MSPAQVYGYFIPDGEDYVALASSMGTACPNRPDAGGIKLTNRIGTAGGFKVAYESVFCNQVFAVLAFDYTKWKSDGYRAPEFSPSSSNREQNLIKRAMRMRDKEFKNLKKVSDLVNQGYVRCAPKPYATGWVEFADNMGTWFPAIAEELIYDPSLNDAFRTGSLNNSVGNGLAMDLDSVQVAQIGLDLARATTTVHQIGPHRDIKPSNFSYGRSSGRVTVLDWGTMVEEAVEDSEMSSLYISNCFTAPERDYDNAVNWLFPSERQGKSVTHSKLLDVYSLGVTMAYLRIFFTLGGEFEFFKQAVMSTRVRTDTITERRPFSLQDQLREHGYDPTEEDAALSEIILGCTEPHPSKRMSLEKLIESLEVYTDTYGQANRTASRSSDPLSPVDSIEQLQELLDSFENNSHGKESERFDSEAPTAGRDNAKSAYEEQQKPSPRESVAKRDEAHERIRGIVFCKSKDDERFAYVFHGDSQCKLVSYKEGLDAAYELVKQKHITSQAEFRALINKKWIYVTSSDEFTQNFSKYVAAIERDA